LLGAYLYSDGEIVNEETLRPPLCSREAEAIMTVRTPKLKPLALEPGQTAAM
jgi:hypothetical protein